jgi:hypothetical protein
MGLPGDPRAGSWNSGHTTRGSDGGCSQADLRSTGGDGLFYCFAANWRPSLDRKRREGK